MLRAAGALRRTTAAAVLACGLVLTACGGGDETPESAPSPSVEVVPNADAPGPTAPADDDEFCTAYRALAEAQALFAAETDGAEVGLRDAADTLLALGIPAGMPDAARVGYAIELEGIYGSLGVQLDPEALPTEGGPDEDGPEDGPEDEHGSDDHAHEHDLDDPTYALVSYVSNHCPA